MPDPFSALEPLVNQLNGIVSPFTREAYAPFKYEVLQENFNQLKKKVEEANDKLTELKKKDSGVAVLTNEAWQWGEKVIQSLGNVNEKLEYMGESIEATCACGCLPNCCRRRAAKSFIQQEIKKFDEFFKSYMPVVKGYRRPQNDTVQKTRCEEIRRIWDYISQRDEVNVVCIHGVAFVGKTAIAEAICNKALLDDHETFSYIIWVDLDYKFDGKIKSLQEKIMRTLNIDIIGTDEDKDRAFKIRNELSQRKKCLVIIDFLWEDFTLQDIGIPEEVEVEGMVCKVILTSRSPLTCPRIHKNEYIEIKPLTEGWTFFEEIINESLESLKGEAEDLVKKAVEVCQGSPPEIIKLASRIRALMQVHSSNDIVSRLKEMLSSQTLSEPSLDTHTLGNLEVSYKRLNSATSQQCFLYCALYPKGYPIEVEELIDNWMWEGLLDNCLGALEQKRNLGKTVLTALKSARLLQNADTDPAKDRVRMLSLFHDMAMNIMHRQRSKDFINSENDLTDFPVDGLNEEIERASFMHNKISALTNQPNCPNLTTLLLQNNPLKEISVTFFSKIPNLKILNLSYTKIYKIPSSICHLKLLRVLQLRHCLNLRFLPCLSKLVKLVLLDLFGTPLKELPLGMEKLKKLKRLNLSHTNLIKFQVGLVSALESLQELLLLMNNPEAHSWRSKKSRSAEAYVEELACLDGLRVLQLNFYNKAAFDKYIKAIPMQRPRAPRFKFCVGGFVTYGNLGDNSIAFIDDFPTNYQLLPEEMMELHMSMCSLTPNNTLLNSGIIFKKLKVLHLSNCNGLTYIFSFEILHCLRNLKTIYVRDCWSILGIIEPKLNSSIDPQRVSSCCLPQLEELVLIDLQKLESICPGQSILEWPAFRRLSVWNCDKLKRLPSIVSKVGENPKRIKLKGDNFSLDDLNQFDLEEAHIPKENFSFISTKKQESCQERMAKDDLASFFWRKATGRTNNNLNP